MDTFIQLFAAFYVTLSVENQIFRQFWTPKYYKTIENLIPKYGFRHSTRLQQQFTKKIQELSRDLETESRKKGTCMLLACIVLLVYSIFLPDSTIIPVSLSLSLTVYSILVLTGIVFSHHWFKRWRYVVIHGTLSLLIAIVVGCIYRKWSYLIDDTLESHNVLLENIMKISILSVLILPIIWQLFINWLYSEVFQKHLIRLLNSEADLYRKFWGAYTRNDQNEIPSEYGSIIIAAFMNGRSGDLQITDAANTLYSRLLSACTRPRIRKLLRYIFKKREEINSIGMVDLNYLPDVNEQVPTRPVSRTTIVGNIRDKEQGVHRRRKKRH